MNNITFSGKREVVYGLNQAAAYARAVANCRAASLSPKPINKSHLESDNIMGLGAYLDMTCYDKSFSETITGLTKKQLEKLAKILKPESVQYGKINPLEIFKEHLNDVLSVHKNSASKEQIKTFFNNIESFCKQM